jgi:hypothetical protein
MGSQLLSPKYDLDTYMATLLGGEALDLCWRLDRPKSLTQLSTQILQLFMHKMTKI